MDFAGGSGVFDESGDERVALDGVGVELFGAKAGFLKVFSGAD